MAPCSPRSSSERRPSASSASSAAPRGKRRAQVGHQGAEVHRLPLDGQPVEHRALRGRQARDLRVEQPADVPEHRLPLGQEGGDLPAEERADRLAHHQQGERVAPVAGDQRLPGGRVPDQARGPPAAPAPPPRRRPPSRSARTGACAPARGPSSGGSSRLVSTRQLGWPASPSHWSTCPYPA